MRFRRLAAAAAAGVTVLAVAIPSYAHEESALYALTVIQSVTPATEGVEIRIVHLDSPALVITNETSEVVTVFGEKGEPFLQIGPDGVRANVESPTTYRSAVPRRDIAPADIDPKAKPEWSRFSEEPTWTWFDPRLRFVPGTSSWEIGLEVGNRETTIDGGYETLQGHGHFITEMEPPDVEGLDLRLTQGLIPAVYVRNDTGEVLEVTGDAGEPFLQIGPDGVRANLRSPTYYTSGSTSILKVPATADAGAEPNWSEVSTVPVWAWLERKAAVPAELYQRAELGSERRTVLEWTSDYVLGGEPLAVEGHVEWVPPAGGTPTETDEGVPWYVIAGVGMAGVAAAGALMFRRPRAKR
jgi:hypothetical protein